jgi:hypothetical protein
MVVSQMKLISMHWEIKKNVFVSQTVCIMLRNYLDKFCFCTGPVCRSQWPCGLGRRSAAAGLLRLWVRISPGAWLSDCYECCVLSGRDLCDGLITRLEESYGLWRVVVCDLETSWMRRPWSTGGCCTNKSLSLLLSFSGCSQNTGSQRTYLRTLLLEEWAG